MLYGIILGKDTFNDMTTHIGKPVTPALVFVNKFFMIISEEIQDGSLKIVNVDAVFRDVVAKIICLAINQARLDATAGHPD